MNDTASTRTRLLLVGRKMFSEKGFERTTVRQLTSAAGANLGAVTYHFGSKLGLYDAVLDQLLGRFADHVEAAARADGAAGDRLAGIVHAIFRFFTDHPEVPRLIVRTLAREGGVPPVAQHHARRNLAAIGGVVTAGRQAGELRDVEPMLAAFTVLSQSIWFALVRRELGAIAGRRLETRESGEQMERHIADVVRRAFAQGIA